MADAAKRRRNALLQEEESSPAPGSGSKNLAVGEVAHSPPASIGASSPDPIFIPPDRPRRTTAAFNISYAYNGAGAPQRAAAGSAAGSGARETTKGPKQPPWSERNANEPDDMKEARQTIRTDARLPASILLLRTLADCLRLKTKDLAADLMEDAIVNPAAHHAYLSEILGKVVQADTIAGTTGALSHIAPETLDMWEALITRWVTTQQEKAEERRKELEEEEEEEEEEEDSDDEVAEKQNDDAEKKDPMETDTQQPAVPKSEPGTDKPPPFSFADADATTRIDVLYALCLWCCEEVEATREYVDSIDASLLRMSHVGTDALGHRYYFFAYNGEDCYLYKEAPPSTATIKPSGLGSAADPVAESEVLPDVPGMKDGGPKWCVAAVTLDEIRALIDRFAKQSRGASSSSGSAAERKLGNALCEDVMPLLVESAPMRDRARKKWREMEAMPRKKSSRVQILASVREEEARRREEVRAKAAAEKAAKEAEREEQMREVAREERRRKRMERERGAPGARAGGSRGSTRCVRSSGSRR